jgi:hypothetical protein
LTVFVPPIRSNSCSCSTEKLRLELERISPTSSRKSVPPSATWNRPIFWAIAPVKAPFS